MLKKSMQCCAVAAAPERLDAPSPVRPWCDGTALCSSVATVHLTPGLFQLGRRTVHPDQAACFGTAATRHMA